MATLTEIIARAEQLAVGRGIDPHQSQLIDSEMTAETIMPHALRYVIRKQIAEEPGALNNLVREQFIDLTNGEGVLDETFMREYLDSSYITGKPYASLVPYTDFDRQRYDNLICYYTASGLKFRTSCGADDPTETPVPNNGEMDATADFTVMIAPSANFSVDNKDNRLQITDGTTLVFDGFVDDANSATELELRGRNLATTSAGNAIIWSQVDYITLREHDATVTTTAFSNVVNVTNGRFTSRDIGRRYTITDNTGAIVVDAIITAVNSLTQIELGAKVLAAGSNLHGSVRGLGVYLNIPSFPSTDLDADEELDISEKLVDDVVVTIAAVLTGDIRFDQLLNYKMQ